MVYPCESFPSLYRDDSGLIYRHMGNEDFLVHMKNIAMLTTRGHWEPEQPLLR